MRELAIEKNLLKSLCDTFKNKLSLFAWEINSGDRLTKAKLDFIKFDQPKNKMVFSPADITGKFLKNMIKGDGFLKFYIPELALAFESEIIEFTKSDQLSVRIPLIFKYYDRRVDERVEILSNIEILVRRREGMFTVKCDDISLGGCSVFVNKNIFSSVQIYDLFLDSEVCFEHTKFNVDLFVNGIEELGNFQHEKIPYANRRISFSFKNISKNNRHILQNFIVLQKKLLNELV